MEIIYQHDGYKADHRRQFPAGTEFVYSNFTARGPSRIPGIDRVLFFGLQRFLMKRLIGDFAEFFSAYEPADIYQRRMNAYLGVPSFPVEHIRDLHALGYIPIRIKALPEGALVPFGVPLLTIENTDSRFAWLTNFLETMLSAELWPTCTSATIAFRYRQVFERFAQLTGADPAFVKWQGHDFSMRGMFGIEAAAMSGMAHLLSFTGSDTVPAIDEFGRWYQADAYNDLVAGSVPATEHAVMCAGGEDSEIDTFRRLLRIYPTGIVSVVSDTWDFWHVVSEVLPAIRPEVVQRDGKLVIRPDSGDPVEILCGSEKEHPDGPRGKGLIQCLWEIFGGTYNAAGFRQLDPHIGAIYGDSITLQRQEEILRRLKAKGFASSNVVLGIGSYSYQGVTRDTFGFAMKATHVVVNGEPRDIYKRPKTDSGKNSHRGLLRVDFENGAYKVLQGSTRGQEEGGCLEPVFENGAILRSQPLFEIRERIDLEFAR